MAAEKSNTYLDQVVAKQAQLEGDLKARRSAPPAYGGGQPEKAPSPRQRAKRAVGAAVVPGAPPVDRTVPGVDVRISGFWRWKSVLVPPNAFVVHTRRGRSKPLHIGMGVSFRYNPSADSFLVVPGATQTILINAYCICRELQGVLVQGYVQWIIHDFATAYRKLDFSDPDEPMRLVNIQLREQAEAAIKDKVSTMKMHDVLSDKQPIIEELTARLRAVAEGEDNSEQGLGLRIVTVQIKEAVVSSSRLWQHLQKPYRTEQERVARLAELATGQVISEREIADNHITETRRMESEQELSEIRDRNDARGFDSEVAERLRRAKREHDNTREMAEIDKETTLHALSMERERFAEEAEMGRLRIQREQELKRLELDGELSSSMAQASSDHERALLQLERDQIRTTMENEQTPASIQANLVKSLPEIVEKLPTPDELRTVAIAGHDRSTVAGLVAELTSVVGVLRSAIGDGKVDD